MDYSWFDLVGNVGVLLMVIALLIPSCESVVGAIAWYSAGYSIAPVAMITDCPAIRRGIDATVPMVSGFVSEIVVP